MNNDNRAIQIFKALGGIRDGLLVSISITYLVGYATWCIVAWSNGLGLVPAIDAQYFVAGVPVIIFFGAMVFTVQLLKKTVFSWWPNFFDHRKLYQQWLIFWFILVIMFISIFLGTPQLKLLYTQQGVESITLKMSLVIAVLGILFMRTPVSISASRHDRFDHFHNFLKKAYIYLFVPLLFFAIIIFYVSNIYVKIPQIFGGGKPRSAQLELLADKVSAETINEIGTVKYLKSGSRIIRTRDIQILSKVGDTLLIKFTEPDSASEKKRLELSRSAVVAILWKD